jgi:hypothetical protein
MGNLVEVVDALCAKRTCFNLFQDKGTFVQGRGYTSYHAKPQWVCGRRHLHGCPHVAVCTKCRVLALELQKVCSHCGGALEPYDEKPPEQVA